MEDAFLITLHMILSAFYSMNESYKLVECIITLMLIVNKRTSQFVLLQRIV